MSNKKRALGRGLEALLANSGTDITTRNLDIDKGSEQTVGNIAKLKVEQIETNPFQPRTEFEEEALIDLAASIKELGIIQPITVRKLGNDKYQLISGERRYRASQLAGLKELPAYVRVANDQAMLEMALVENIQRSDLNPIEVAISYQRLIDDCGLTQEELGDRVGKKRSSTSNYLRLLKLPPEIQQALKDKAISFGHARTLIAMDDEEVQLFMFDQIIKDNLSVRKIEEMVRETKKAASQSSKKEKPALSLPQQKFSENLKKRLKAQVAVKPNNKGGGNIVISFKSEDDLQRIIDALDA